MDVSVTGNIESAVNVRVLEMGRAIYCQIFFNSTVAGNREVFTHGEIVVSSYIANEVGRAINSLVAFDSSIAFGGGIAFERGITFDSEILVHCLISFDFRIAINGLVAVDVSITGYIKCAVNIRVLEMGRAVYGEVFFNSAIAGNG